MISRRSIELQPWAFAVAGSMISRKSKSAQFSEEVDDITKIKSGAIFGAGRRHHKNHNRRNDWSDLPGDITEGERIRQKDTHRAT